MRHAQDFTVAVFRLGHYGGEGARQLTTSPPLAGTPRPVPAAAPETGTTACDWPVSWSLDIPADWVSGIFLAVFTAADGHRSYTPFVVRDTSRPSDLLVVLPFTTYQAYNMWPEDGRTGKNLYRGQLDGKVGGFDERAVEVSFDRPYAQAGLPRWFNLDTTLAGWVEQGGYDVTYATSVDLHEGRIDPSRHRAIIFPGHDEYWSRAMRNVAEDAVKEGTHLAFLAANNIYFHIRLEPAADGRANRIVACYKSDADLGRDINGQTGRWRDLGRFGRAAEQGLLGVQYNGILSPPAPLVVRSPGHWFWAGTGLRDGDEIPGLVAVEADGYDPEYPLPSRVTRTLLSESPYMDRKGRGRRVQNSGLYETEQGALVFAAGTFHWPLALGAPGHTDKRVQTATRNLLTHMLRDTGR
ncbi:hypothetical protein NLX86_05985 [Streptomyces sp. A3M-1-3]|uniref:N,N-dimethylformamidase beta subunit family domain-containing protein n=1 Tax=Streptomyces sp. A3M-1-3 TaxID=2962044 RepID=UPI0020B83FC8|nr:N,N-dimethylformamidase beta subunit family domain-containing protein [Streptomyces sp. A3M-1-3]MCP3817698.1 hypothetical protein [Streptomyces sp. A3M-1-3]